MTEIKKINLRMRSLKSQIFSINLIRLKTKSENVGLLEKLNQCENDYKILLGMIKERME